MALGSLVVSLGLDAADFISGLTKSEQQAKKFGSTIDRAVAAGVVKAEIAIQALGVAARTTAEVFQSLTTGAGQFKDLEETTGAAAESIASLAVSAAVAGVDINDVAGAANKLTKNLVGVDDESKAAGAALKALNLNVDDFKKLDPVGQYEAVGKALGGFADGAGKVAVAQALFGKSGAEQLRVFKALEEAGGAQTILTARQIQLADDYGDQQAKTTAQLRLYAQAAASEAIPAIADATRVAADFARELLGVDNATGKLSANNGAKAFAEGVADSFAFAADQVDLFVRIFQLVGKTLAGVAAVNVALVRGGVSAASAAADAALEDLQKVIDKATFADRLAQQRIASANARLGQDPTELARRGRGPATLPPLKFDGPAKDTTQKITEEQRYLEALLKTLQATFSLTEAEKVLQDIQAGRAGKIGVVQQQVLLGLAEEIDATKEAQRVSRERADAKVKDYEAANEAARANEQAERDRLKALLDNTPSRVFEKQQADLEFLRQAYYDAKISVEQYGEAVTIVMGLSSKAIDDTIRVAEDLGSTIAQGFADAALEGKGLTETIHDLDKALARIAINELFTKPFQQFLGGNGQASGGGGLIGLLGNLVSSYLGGGTDVGVGTNTTGTSLPTSGGRAIGGPTMPNSLYQVAEHRPETWSDGSGTYLLTGSRRGYVNPNPRMGGSRTINAPITINLPGGTDRRTASQIGAEVARQLAVVNARNN